MAQTISIGATQHIDLLKARLGRALRLFEGEGLKVELEESPAGKFTFLACRVAPCGECGYTGEDARAILKHHLADVISDAILNHWEDGLLRSIIRENYYYFNDEEKKSIYNYALRHINGEGEGCRNTIHWLGRKSRIAQKVLEFLRHNDRIIIDGFIRFRLKEYVGELREAADRAVDDFLMEREYREFIQLLKYFVEIQEPRIEVVHVLIRPGGKFRLFDGKFQPVKSDYLEGFAVDLVDSEINYEDLLISALITLSPKSIILHCKDGPGPPAMLETIKSVFTGRVAECKGCHLCVAILKV
ncbi:MAG: putative sporulation protein YtxC [Peptococcaceae bacterium]|nr:putative sporulation protein YtxC [Peptococcaceae bacterium]